MAESHTPSERLERNGDVIGLVLHDGRNPILRFEAPSLAEPFLWGFSTVADWRSFLKMCLRFDDAIGDTRKGN